MGFSLSASVNVTEKDLTVAIPAVSTSIGAFAGHFEWGPVDERVLIDTEDTLIKKFAKPTDNNFADWFTAANFLSYSNACEVVRSVGAAALNAGDAAGILVKNQDHYDLNLATIEASLNKVIAKYPGTYGNDITVSMADAAAFTGWTYENDFEYAPTGNEFWVVVLYKGNIVEKFYVNRDTDSKDHTGRSNYAPELINRTSEYIWIVATNLITYTAQVPDSIDADFTLASGTLVAPSDGERQTSYDLFANPDAVDVNLVMTGPASTVVGTYVIQNIADVRKDCVAFVSPQETDIVGVADPVTAAITTRNSFGSSSYAVMDNNFKYQYDKYNDKYRWVPLNGDIAGLCARTDDVADPWFSPGGPNRGQIKNVVKLAYNPSKAQRDKLYKSSINPVVTFAGEGTLLYGDKTLQTKPSAFDRINVRRLFIVLEKAIATAAKYYMFEFNDAFTRTLFVNAVEPYLRNIQGRRGIHDFRVVADERNNTQAVIDNNEFVADIYIKPARSINFIYLNFSAVGTGVVFEELIGEAA